MIHEVLNAAYLFRFVREEPRNTNKGQAVEEFQRFVGIRVGKDPWCAAWVSYVMKGMLGSNCPVPPTGSCWWLGENARRSGLLVDTPAVGDIFLLFDRKLNRFAHTGFITGRYDDTQWRTIEGNTGDAGQREGWGVFERTRTFKAEDKFIRWINAL